MTDLFSAPAPVSPARSRPLPRNVPAAGHRQAAPHTTPAAPPTLPYFHTAAAAGGIAVSPTGPPVVPSESQASDVQVERVLGHSALVVTRPIEWWVGALLIASVTKVVI